MTTARIAGTTVIFDHLRQTSTLEMFNQNVRLLYNSFNGQEIEGFLTPEILDTIKSVFSDALTRLKDCLRPLHEVEQDPYNRFISQLFGCIRIHGQKALYARAEICTFVEACNKAPRSRSTIEASEISGDGTLVYRGINIVDLPRPLAEGKYRFENCEFYGTENEKRQVSMSECTHLTFSNHQGTNLRLVSADKLQVLICENNPYLRTINERVFSFDRWNKLQEMVFINNPMIEEHDLRCFFESFFSSRYSNPTPLQLTVKDSPGFTDKLFKNLRGYGLTVEQTNKSDSPDAAKTYLISIRSRNKNPVSSSDSAGFNKRAFYYGILAGAALIVAFYGIRYFARFWRRA